MDSTLPTPADALELLMERASRTDLRELVNLLRTPDRLVLRVSVEVHNDVTSKDA